MLVLVNYHMDTLSGIGYGSEHIHGGYPCTLVDIYTEREGYIHYLGYKVWWVWWVVTTCLFADVQSWMIFTWMIENCIKIHNDNHVSMLYVTKFIRDKVYTVTKFIHNKIYTVTKFIQNYLYGNKIYT